MFEELSTDPARLALLLAGFSMIVSLTTALYVFVMAGADKRKDSHENLEEEKNPQMPQGNASQAMNEQPLVLDTKLSPVVDASPGNNGSMRRYV